MMGAFLDRYSVMEAIATRRHVPAALKLSHETWRNLINQIPTAEATGYTRLYGIPIEFDETVPVDKYRPVYFEGKVLSNL